MLSQAWFVDDIEDYHDCADPLLLWQISTLLMQTERILHAQMAGAHYFAHEFIKLCYIGQLFNTINQLVMHVPGQKSSILVLVFTSYPNSVGKIQHCSPLGFSDHKCLLFEVKYLMEQCKQRDVIISTKYNYLKADYIYIQL